MWKGLLMFAILCVCGSSAQKIKISVYYETLCSDSVRYLVNQFYPAYQNLADNMEVDLVAYGKANASNDSGSWEFECQHGELECYENKVHSCAIELYPVSQSTEFVICSMNSTDASSDANNEECATSTNISWTVLEECLTSGQADELLAANGRRTDKLIPDIINFVPTIVFNDVFSAQLQSISLTNFEDTLVFLLEQIQCGFCQFNGSNLAVGSGKFVLGVSVLLILLQKCVQTVKVSVFYEALCPDSIEFIDKQLFPTYKYIGNDIKVDLVPFGNAKVTNTSGQLKFVCQHGPSECYGNKIHSCAIRLYSIEESTEFVYCSMESVDPSSNENLEKCANSSDISWASLQTCFQSGQADILLEKNGIRTKNVEPAIKFIPTVIFNDRYNETLQNEALEDFMAVVCQFLEYKPAPCRKYVYGKIEVKLV
ncbi:uncharacterized protein LOC108903177 [Anoplophora glabripennis]|uniref:uncharacterized protein LOC108903177 n=1 Tax=Anoplophora glabripennis TaxID=217634 RepID=UPI00087512F0|nr:uncharacterized protein LOC108903177 [Anoplophora glabripennis]